MSLLKALSAVLDRWGRWYLFGAQAVVAYGVPRFSADVDVTVELAPDEPERFVRDMEVGGFTLRVEDPEFVHRTRVLPFVHVATGMPLDVVLAGSGLEDEFLGRAKTTDMGGAKVPVIACWPAEGHRGRTQPLAAARIAYRPTPRPTGVAIARRRPRPE